MARKNKKLKRDFEGVREFVPKMKLPKIFVIRKFISV